MTALGERFSDTCEYEDLGQPVRRYPVVLEFTEYRVAYIEADTAADALAEVNSVDPSDYWGTATATDVIDGVSVCDGLTAEIALGALPWSGRPLGPVEACPDCGAVTSDTGDSARYARHTPGCAWYVHSVSRGVVWASEKSSERAGWVPECSCGEPGFEQAVGPRTPESMPGRIVYPTEDGASAAARAHVAGRPHYKNVTVGVMEDYANPAPCRREP